MIFAYPSVFFVLLVVPLLVALYIYRRKAPATFTLSTTKGVSHISKGWRTHLFWLPFALLLASIIFVVIALARPQRTHSKSNSTTEGINIVMAMDISTSMLAEDLKPNRLEAAKDVAAQFISSRPNDNIGLVVFAGESFTQCPMTTDQATLLNLLQGIQTGIINDGTAIGNGLATAISRLKDVEGKDSKVVILLTDGSNNSGEITPLTAAEIAQALGVRIYTIGVGTQGTAPYPFQTPFGIQYQNVPVDIDEGTLQSIAEKSGGHYFRATDNNSLEAIYSEIDKMEKIKIKVETFTQKEELFLPFLLAGLVCLVLCFLLRTTLLRTLP
ncbi:aerotolerance regulator BatA [Porphyromonas cangingivalis]|uniref:Aerotolerance regulator BatA n=1 Tax=Porphyromonas cangingivalis TaxID=36874 RepID=A0A0A2EI35_PORCN|nr:VWA domain-containing protein [Porphyromonas cangingivalis]KGN78598.1 aerotolerance regulator BatA [Porphyromonas cangingivalis]